MNFRGSVLGGPHLHNTRNGIPKNLSSQVFDEVRVIIWCKVFLKPFISCVEARSIDLFAIGILLRSPTFSCHRLRVGAGFWEAHATKHFSLKKRVFSEKGGGNSVNEGFGKGFYRQGNSVKRSGPFNENVVLISFPKVLRL